MTAPTDPAVNPTAAPQQPAQPPEGAPTAPADQNVDSLPSWAREAITKANREAANYRTQVAELKPRADQFAALEEASKSELQRLQESLAAEKSGRETAAAEALRMRVAIAHQIGSEDLDLLGSGSEEEITARAERIAALRSAATPTAPTPPPTNRPVEQLRGGATPAEAGSEDDLVYAALFGPQTQ